jgi:hypothetical protein
LPSLESRERRTIAKIIELFHDYRDGYNVNVDSNCTEEMDLLNSIEEALVEEGFLDDFNYDGDEPDAK